MKIIVRLYKNGKVIKRIVAPREKWRKVYAKLASAVADKWFVEVDYGYAKDVFGKRIMFKNTGTYNNLKESQKALQAFIE